MSKHSQTARQKKQNILELQSALISSLLELAANEDAEYVWVVADNFEITLKNLRSVLNGRLDKEKVDYNSDGSEETDEDYFDN